MLSRVLPLLLVGLLFAPVAVPAGGLDGGDRAKSQELTLVMDDGVKLAARLWSPDPPPRGPIPAVILIHGWGGSKGDFNEIGREYASDGYHVLAYDVRGFAKSGGKISVVGPRDVQDVSNLVTWLIEGGYTEPRRIAVGGVSYGGGHSWLVAAQDARVKTVLPLVGWSNLSEALRPSGVTKFDYPFGFYLSGWQLDATILESYDEETVRVATAILAGVPSPEIEPWFRARSADWRIEEINRNDVSVFSMQGWDDWLFPAPESMRTWDALTVRKRISLGGIGHPPASTDVRSPEARYLFGQAKAWVDEELKGRPGPASGLIEVTSAPYDGTSRMAARLEDLSTPVRMHLDPLGRLSASPAPTAVPLPFTNTFVVGGGDDPLEAELLGSFDSPIRELAGLWSKVPRSTPADTLHFYSDPLPEDVELLGPIRLHLPLTLGGPGGRIIVRVYDVPLERCPAPPCIPGEGWRIGDLAAWRVGVEAGLPGFVSEETTWGGHHVYRAGHRIVLALSAEFFPFFGPERAPFVIAVQAGGPGGAHVELPVAKGSLG